MARMSKLGLLGLMSLALALPLAAEDLDAFQDASGPEPALVTGTAAAETAAAAAEPFKAPDWISVEFGPVNACGSRPLSLRYKAQRTDDWQQLQWEPRCSLEWRQSKESGLLVKDPKSLDATEIEAAWMPGGKALLVLQWALAHEGRQLLDARLYRPSGKGQKAKPAMGDGSFYLSPDRRQLWYLSGDDPTLSPSLHRLALDDPKAVFGEPEILSPEAFEGLGAVELEPIDPDTPR